MKPRQPGCQRQTGRPRCQLRQTVLEDERQGMQWCM